MQSRTPYDPRIAAPESAGERSGDTELRILRDVLRMLPTGVTVLDEQGRFLADREYASDRLRNEATSAQKTEVMMPRNRAMAKPRTGPAPK